MYSTANEAKPLIAFFGATGGCCAAALARSLKAGYTCLACTILPRKSKRIICLLTTSTVARTPSKLTSQLLSKGVSQSTITAHLHITEGDVRDIKAVEAALTLDGQIASIILSGIGNNLLRLSLPSSKRKGFQRTLLTLKPSRCCYL